MVGVTPTRQHHRSSCRELYRHKRLVHATAKPQHITATVPRQLEPAQQPAGHGATVGAQRDAVAAHMARKLPPARRPVNRVPEPSHVVTTVQPARKMAVQAATQHYQQQQQPYHPAPPPAALLLGERHWANQSGWQAEQQPGRKFGGSLTRQPPQEAQQGTWAEGTTPPPPARQPDGAALTPGLSQASIMRDISAAIKFSVEESLLRTTPELASGSLAGRQAPAAVGMAGRAEDAAWSIPAAGATGSRSGRAAGGAALHHTISPFGYLPEPPAMPPNPVPAMTESLVEPQAPPRTPFFMSGKTRTLACEMDDPGRQVQC